MPKREENETNDRAGVNKLIVSGAEIAGASVGGALSFIAAGPAGAAVGAAVGGIAAKVLKDIGQEVSERLLAPREKVRLGGALALAASEIKRRQESGESIRSDDFFSKKAHGRSDAEEVAEAVLLKCQREPEEKKIQYMGHLLASVAFNTKISAALAHQLTKTADALTYRQLCILRLAAVKQALKLRKTSYRGQTSFPMELAQILYECHDLYLRGCIGYGGEAAISVVDVNPAEMNVQGLGAFLYDLMKLSKIPATDVKAVADQMK